MVHLNAYLFYLDFIPISVFYYSDKCYIVPIGEYATMAIITKKLVN